ncbi:hypothetical protein N1031_12135 [Herbiconiux moechotypicola]|uniref:Virginiamycin B lyase n=1 Tax=Herbiconiux moechotypicola TaxID=637393 RepID=A0ABP5QP96_9MICO|nr:hypothetical protein [Herbiconiux moechotypicola]MCS5730512.1 hypothetical protein [Herbiconiux moechotypicola]
MSSRTAPVYRMRALAALAAVAVIGGGLAALAPAVGAGALEPPPRDYATWHEYDTATPGGSPGAVTVDATDRVWYADGTSNQIVTFPAETPRSWVAYDLGPSMPGITALVAAPDGTIWFNDSSNGAMGRLDPATGTVSSFPLGTGPDFPASPVLGPDGAIWFGWPAAGGLGRIALDGTISSVPEPTGAQIYNVVSAPDGRLWFTHDATGLLGAYDPVSAAFEAFPVDVPNVSGLGVGRDGSLWVGGTHLLRKVSLAGAVLDTQTIPGAPFDFLQPSSLVTGVDQELYFVVDDSRLGMIDHRGRFAFVVPPFTGSLYAAVAITSYNSLWFTDAVRGKILNG